MTGAHEHPPLVDRWTEMIWAAASEQNANGLRCIAASLSRASVSMDGLAQHAVALPRLRNETPMKHYVAADLHMDMARILIREIEAYLKSVAEFHRLYGS